MTTATLEARRTAAFIHVDGPEPIYNHDGDELPSWTVYAADETGAPVGNVYRLTDRKRTDDLAAAMSRDRGLEIVDDSTPE